MPTKLRRTSPTICSHRPRESRGVAGICVFCPKPVAAPTDFKALEAFRAVVDGCVKGHGGRGDVQETWRGLPAPLQDLGMAEYFMALVEQVTEPG
jgi:hypothetical protein